MCSLDKAIEVSESLEAIYRHYPRTPEARAVVAGLVREMCKTDDAADVLVKEARDNGSPEWPGTREFREFALECFRDKSPSSIGNNPNREWIMPADWKKEPVN